MNDRQVATTAEVPPAISRRLSHWHFLWQLHGTLHYGLGILGVISSTIGTMTSPPYSRVTAGISAVCLAVIGFLQPQRQYLTFVRAWRHLEAASLRYRHGLETIESLLRAMERGEAMITETEKPLSGKKTAI